MKSLCPFEENILSDKNNLTGELKLHLSSCRYCNEALNISENLKKLSLSPQKEKIQLPGYKLLVLKASLQKSDSKKDKFYILQLFLKILLGLIAAWGIFKEAGINGINNKFRPLTNITKIVFSFLHSLSPELSLFLGSGIIILFFLFFYEKVLSEN